MKLIAMGSSHRSPLSSMTKKITGGHSDRYDHESSLWNRRFSCHFLSLLRGQKLRACDLGQEWGSVGGGQLAFDWAGQSNLTAYYIVPCREQRC